jgi:hypothetical protein
VRRDWNNDRLTYFKSQGRETRDRDMEDRDSEIPAHMFPVREVKAHSTLASKAR